MKDQFEVWRYLFPEKGGEHPVVLISHPDICAKAKVVNVLFCTSQRQSRRPYPSEVMLNSADGLDWETLVKCDLIDAARKDQLKEKRGMVSPARRRQIAERVIKSLAFAGL